MNSVFYVPSALLIAGTFSVLSAAPAPWSAPASASSQKNPFAGDQAAIQQGKTIFQGVCIACHGASGKGDGPAGLSLNVHPGDLTSSKLQSESDGAILWKISTGRAPMPPFAEAYGKDDLWKVVSYIRTMSSSGASPAPIAGASIPEKSVTTDAGSQPMAAIASPDFETSDDTEPWGDVLTLSSDRAGFLIAGYAAAGFESIEGGDSTFSAKFAPLLLVKHGDNLLFESEVEFGLEDGVTETELEYAQLLWLVNDHLTVGAGKFLNPMNYFSERIHPSWINKLPTAPLPFGHDSGLIAGTQLGVQARGAFAVGGGRVGYAVYLSNGPSIVIEEEEDGHAEAEEAEPEGHGGIRNGGLDFNNFGDRNDNLAIGGRIGVSPVPGFEIGYGVEFAQVAPSDSEFRNINAVTQSLDFNFIRDVAALRGVIDARAQFIWVDVDNPGIEPLDFENNSSGGYVQLAYRPLKVGNEFLRKLEPVCRYDWVDLPGEFPDQERISFGVNYWINSSTVLKAAVEFGEESDEHGTEDYTGFRVQAAIGF